MSERGYCADVAPPASSSSTRATIGSPVGTSFGSWVTVIKRKRYGIMRVRAWVHPVLIGCDEEHRPPVHLHLVCRNQVVGIDDRVWDATVFTKNQERLLSQDHFLMDGTQIEA